MIFSLSLTDIKYRAYILFKLTIKYNKEADAIYLKFSNAEVAESDEDKPDIITDYDKEGKIVGIEILDASQRTDNPSSVFYEVAWFL